MFGSSNTSLSASRSSPNMMSLSQTNFRGQSNFRALGDEMPPNYHQRLDYIETEIRKMRSVHERGLQGMGSGMGTQLQPFPGQFLPPVNPAPAQQALAALTEHHMATMESHSDLTKAYNDLAKAHAQLLQKYGDTVTGDLAQGSPASAAAKLRPGTSSGTEGAGIGTVSNEELGMPPLEMTLLSNTLLFLPGRAVTELGIEPNMDDKGDPKKELWFGRLWELRSLLKVKYEKQQKLTAKRESSSALTTAQKRDMALKMSDPVIKARLIRLQARWKGAVYRLRCSFAVLSRLKFCQLRGLVVFCHGSGGCSWDNMRVCRMISRMGYLVVAPDGFAYPSDTAMGKLRHKDLLPLHKATDDVDYWAGDLIYAGAATGNACYSTDANKVLEDPEAFRELYEKCYQLRRSELHFTISKLPMCLKTKGFFIGGASEGGMTVARFDDQRYGEMVMGRFINVFSVEYCYFTPKKEDGELGGQLDVPTLQIIGTKDPYFGPEDSVAKIIAEDPKTGYGAKDYHGNGYNTFVRQGLEAGLVCILENGVHSPCDTHDNFMRQVYETFFSRPEAIWELDAIWDMDPDMKDRVQVQQTCHDDKSVRACVTQVFVPLPAFPNKWSLRKLEAMQGMKSSAMKTDMLQELEKDALKHQELHAENKSMLDKLRKSSSHLGGKGFSEKAASGTSYYQGDKMSKTNALKVKQIP